MHPPPTYLHSLFSIWVIEILALPGVRAAKRFNYQSSIACLGCSLEANDSSSHGRRDRFAGVLAVWPRHDKPDGDRRCLRCPSRYRHPALWVREAHSSVPCHSQPTCIEHHGAGLATPSRTYGSGPRSESLLRGTSSSLYRHRFSGFLPPLGRGFVVSLWLQAFLPGFS